MVVHCEPRIPWQPKRAAYFAEGFRAKGIPCEITASRTRIDDCPAVLLGTSCWRGIERDGGEFLLVDRCSFGDTEKFVSLVWNGHGRRGDHRVPKDFNSERWERYGIPLADSVTGTEIVLCGQVETYSDRYLTPRHFYDDAQLHATAFRPHPADNNYCGKLPVLRSWIGVGAAIVLNSSVGCDAVMRGIPTWAWDEGAMCYPVACAEPTMDRTQWCHWLAWTQWTDDEIKEGTPWDWHL
jgi:hypothetical protein